MLLDNLLVQVNAKAWTFGNVDEAIRINLHLLLCHIPPYWSRLHSALVHESELARNEPDSQVHHLPRAYDDGLPSSAIRLRM